MRLITIVLAVLLLLIQYPLWMGKGGFFRARELSIQVDAAKEKNEETRQRNARLASEVRNLEVGTEAIEERARQELGMIKKDEIFIQIIDTAKIPDKGKPVEGDLALPVAKTEGDATAPQAQKPAATSPAATATRPAANMEKGTTQKTTQ